MRIVTTPTFCKACIEGLWHSLLRRVELVDDIVLGCVVDANSTVYRTIDIKLLELAQFRKEPITHLESYVITWRRDGVDLEEFANATSIVFDDTMANYSVHVQFVTDEVRVDPKGYLQSTSELEVKLCETS